MAKGNFIEYVVSDDPNKYLNNGEQGGYYYELVEDVTPEVTTQTPIITQIAENLGVTITTPSGTNKQVLQGNNANLQLIAGYEPPFRPVTWAGGTDKEIVAMVAAADAGLINLSDYWTAGDTRTVHLDAMPASYGQTAKPEMDVQMILVQTGGISTIDEVEYESFTVLIYAPQLTNMKRHSEATINRNNVIMNGDTITDEAIYSWLNDTFANSLSKSFKSIFGNARSMIIADAFISTYITSTFRPPSYMDGKLIGEAALQLITSTYTSEAWLSDYYPHDAYTSSGICINMEEPNYVRKNVNLNEEAGMFYLVGYIRGGPKAVKFTVDGWETNKNFAKEGDTWNDVYSSIYAGADTSLSIQDGRVYTTRVLGSGYLTLNGQPVYATDQIVNGARYVVEEDTTS